MDTNEPMDQGKTATKVSAARLSIISNSVLSLAKLVVGLSTGSVGVIAEAAHSGVDLLASWIAYFAVRIADQPPDADHPYGHGKAESLSGVAEALLIVFASIAILFEASHKIIHQETPSRFDFGIGIMAISAIVNSFVAVHLSRVGKETQSLALEADSAHLKSDVWTSLAVLAGLLISKMTGILWVDPLFAIGIAMFILGAAWSLFKKALNPLMDQHLPVEDTQIVVEIFEADPNVKGFHKLRTRQSGSFRYVDAHVQMDDNLTLLQAHEFTEGLEDAIRKRLPRTEITLHTEPYLYEIRHQHEKHGVPLPPEQQSHPEK